MARKLYRVRYHLFEAMNKNTGFTLIEVLIAMLVLAVGLLGLAGLQATRLKNAQSAYNRSVATELAFDLADRMRANNTPNGLSVYISMLPVNALAQANCVAVSTLCPSNVMAQNDLYEWNLALVTTLPSGQGIVCTLNNVVGSGISTTLSFNGTTIIADIYGILAVPQASIPLPPQASTPNTYAITLTAGQLTDCVYSLIVTNNTSKGISYNGVAIVNGTPLNVLVTVTNGQTLASGLVWSGLANWGGPSAITVTCKSDGTGYVSSIDHGSFSTDYQPTMTATVSGNPNTFTQTGGQSGSAWNTFLNNLPATGGSINLTFTDS